MPSRRRRGEQVPEAPRPEPRPYYALTTSHLEVAHGLQLDAVFDSTNAVLAKLKSDRDAVDTELAQLADEAEFRRRRRGELAAQRDQFAAESNVDAVANATTLIDATERVDAAQSRIAEQKRQQRTELDRQIAAAEDDLRAARAAVDAHAVANKGKAPRFLIDYHVRRTIKHYMGSGDDPHDRGDSVLLVTALGELPDTVAEQVAADPKLYAEMMQDDMKPKPNPRPSLEEARAMVEEGRRLIAEYEHQESAYWGAVAVAPHGTALAELEA